MAKMYPQNIEEYMPTDSEKLVYYELKRQLPDSFEVFYSVTWSRVRNGRKETSEADFIVVSPDYGYLCLEVKGGCSIRVDENIWYVSDSTYGERKLECSPYEQAEKSMYFFKDTYSNAFHIHYQGIYGAGVVYPFYSVDNIEAISNRSRICTIDCFDLNDVYSHIVKLFKHWGGATYGNRFYSKQQHRSFVESIKKRIAISAAAGALVKYKERQLNVVNRVQDGYIYLLSNIQQFYIRGGAGTGKTWIAIKMANAEVEKGKRDVLLLCASDMLSEMIRTNTNPIVCVKSIRELFEEIADNFDSLISPHFEGVSESVREDCRKYDAVFIDEAQDFTEEWAYIAKSLLKDENQSRFGVFYDDIQTLNGESFSNAFMIETPPFLLRENIRNTASIYNWASDKTHLGRDVIANPVEGPIPINEVISDKRHLIHRMENLFKEYLEDEHLTTTSLTILVDDYEYFSELLGKQIAKWELVNEYSNGENQILMISVEKYKGLESDMVIYIRKEDTIENVNYIAYTRARYYLIEIVYRCHCLRE